MRGLAALATVLAGAGLAPLAASAASSPVVVSLTFNDGLASQYANALPILEQYGVHGTFYVASDVVTSGDANYMRAAQLDELARAGNEIGGMGASHPDLTKLTAEQAREEVCSDRTWLAGRGYDPVSFAYPFAAVDATAEAVVEGCGYRSGRTVGGLAGSNAAEKLPPADPFHVSTAGLTGSPTLASLQAAVTAAASDGGGWLPIAFNGVCSRGSAGYDTCMKFYEPVQDTVLSAFLDWLQDQGDVTVRTVRQVMGAGAVPQPPDRPEPETYVSLTFDDGRANQYPIRKVLNEHGVHATYYINSGPIDKGYAVMTWDQVRQLAADGDDIGGHTRDHVRIDAAGGLSLAERRAQVCDNRQRLIAQGFHPVSFAYPEGAIDDAAQQIVEECGYTSARSAGSLLWTGPHYAEPLPPEHPYAVWALGALDDKAIRLEDLKEDVTKAAENGGGWVPVVMHDVCYAGTTGYDTCIDGYRPISDTTIDQFLDWAQADAQQQAGIRVRSMAEVMGGGTGGSVPVPAPPTVSVTSPVPDASTGARPTIAGTASADAGKVGVAVYDGRSASGTPVAAWTVTAAASWSTRPASALAPGVYTVQASQTRSGVTGVSPPVTFTVAAAPGPTVTGVTPARLGRGAVWATVRVRGSGFGQGTQAAVSGPGVRFSLVSRSADTLTLAVSVDADAATTARDVTVSGPGAEKASCAGCLQVVAGPRVTRVSPNAVERGRSTTVRIDGSGFDSDTEVAVAGGGISVKQVRAVSGSRLDVTLEVSRRARTGSRTLTVWSGSTQGSTTVTGAVSVTRSRGGHDRDHGSHDRDHGRHDRDHDRGGHWEHGRFWFLPPSFLSALRGWLG